MATTMREVAAAAGVSIATVSYVVNNTKPVTPETRRRIEQAMADLGFRRNLVARALASNRTRLLALACPFFEDRLALTTRDFIVGAARAANDADHHLVIWPVSNHSTELADLMSQKLVDGVVLMAVQLDDPRVDQLRAADMPFALIGRTRDVTGLHWIDIDMEESMRIAMDHLIGLGHTRITFINGSQDHEDWAGFGPYVRSEQAYRELSAAHGLEPVVLRGTDRRPVGRDAVVEMLDVAPDTTAVIVMDESAAPGVVTELSRRGKSVPGDFSVVSMLSSIEASTLCNPPLTTVTAPGQELGRLGIEALLAQLTGRSDPAPRLRTGELIVGESTAAPRPSRRRRTPYVARRTGAGAAS
jgi:DNA-binding LacI/PurR family transcriptional regulator